MAGWRWVASSVTLPSLAGRAHREQNHRPELHVAEQPAGRLPRRGTAAGSARGRRPGGRAEAGEAADGPGAHGVSSLPGGGDGAGSPLDAWPAGRGDPGSGSPCLGYCEWAAGAVGKAGADPGSPCLRSLLVLDELDQLESKGQDVLYTLFEWPRLPGSRLVLMGECAAAWHCRPWGPSFFWGADGGVSLCTPLLPTRSFFGVQPSSSLPHLAVPVGLANALDLTDRSLARLGTRPAGSPQLLHFPPYTREQLTAILQERLGQVGTQGDTAGGGEVSLPTQADSIRCLGRWLVTPSWMPPRSSSAPARSPRSPVMLARPWMSAGQRLPQNPAVPGPAWPLRTPHSSPVPGVPVLGQPLCPVLRAVSPQARRGGGGAGGAEPDPAQAAAWW